MSEGSASSTASSSSSDDTDHEFPLIGTASDFMRTHAGSLANDDELDALTFVQFRLISLHLHPNSETNWIAIDRETGEWWDMTPIMSERITVGLEATADEPGVVALEEAIDATGIEGQRPYIEMLRAEGEQIRDMMRERAEHDPIQWQQSQWAIRQQALQGASEEQPTPWT